MVRNTLLAGTALALTFTAFTAAYAADAASDDAAPAATAAPDADAPDSGDIIVTARHRAEAAQDVPLAIGTLNSKAINDTGASTIYKVQQLAPSLQVYSQNPRNTAINIRGIGLPFGQTNDGVDPGVGIYVDDVYYARPASAMFDFLDVSQVEVLRGPQGTLYGKNTTAGAINIRTNQPTFDYEGTAELSVGNYNFKQFKGAISGPLSDTVAPASPYPAPIAAAPSTTPRPTPGRTNRTIPASAPSCCSGRTAASISPCRAITARRRLSAAPLSLSAMSRPRRRRHRNTRR